MRKLLFAALALVSSWVCAATVEVSYTWTIQHVSDPAASSLVGKKIVGTLEFDEVTAGETDGVKQYPLISHTLTLDGQAFVSGQLNNRGNRTNTIRVGDDLYGPDYGDLITARSTVSGSYSTYTLESFGFVLFSGDGSLLSNNDLTEAALESAFELAEGRLTLATTGGQIVVASSQNTFDTYAVGVPGGGPPQSGHLFADAALNTWVTAPGTDLESVLPPESFSAPVTYPGSSKTSPGPMFGAWNGAAWYEAGSEMHGIANGGHADYCGNEHVKFDVDDLAWTVLRGPTTDFTGFDANNAQAVMNDGRPYSRHTYGGQLYMPNLDQFILAGGSLCSGAGTMGNDRWLISRDGQTTTLVAGGTHWRVGMQLEYDTVNQQAYLAWGGTWYSVANADLSLTQLYAGFSYDTSRMGSAIDPARRTMFILGNGRAYGFNLDTNTQTSYSAATGMDLIKDCNAPGVEYASHLDKYVAWCGGNDLFLIDPVNFTVTTLVTTGLAPGTSGSVGNGIYGRFRYSEKYGGLVVAYSISSDVYFVHLHDTGIGGTPPANNVYPQITDLSPQTTPESIPLIIDGRSGDRPEIGLFTEWQSEFFVTGAHAQHILDQADDRLDEPWCDMAKMTAKPWAPVEGYAGNVSFSHQPNAFFVPYLETGDVKYVVPMECTWQIYQEFRQKLQYAAMMHYTGRDGAWMLRNLGELAYIEKLGDTLAADHTQENAVLAAIYNFTRARSWENANALPATDIANEVKQLGQDIYDNYVNGVAYGSMNLNAIEADIQTYIDTLPVGWNRSAIQAAKDHIAAMRAGVSFPYYQTILKHTLYKYMLDTVQPVQRGFNAIGVRQFGTPTWTGWMESFNGQVIYHIVDLMQAAGDSVEEANWLTLAEWHFQHLIARCGGTVGMIYCDNDHVSPVTDWSDTNLYSQERLDAIAGYPVNELPPKYINGIWITYDDRIDNARTWAAMAAENGTPGAQALYDSIQAAIVTRDGAGGATNWYKYSIEVPQ